MIADAEDLDVRLGSFFNWYAADDLEWRRRVDDDDVVADDAADHYVADDDDAGVDCEKQSAEKERLPKNIMWFSEHTLAIVTLVRAWQWYMELDSHSGEYYEDYDYLDCCSTAKAMANVMAVKWPWQWRW